MFAQERMCSLVNKTKVDCSLWAGVLLSTAQVVVFMRGTERRPILYLAFARPWYTERQRNFAAEKLFE